MLKKESKLTAKDLLKLKKEGKRVHFTLFSVMYMSGVVFKMSVSVPKKLYKNAVDRNRAKRRVFGVIHELSPIKMGYYDLFMKQNINNVSYTDLKKEVQRIICLK